MTVRQKLGMILDNKVVQKLKLENIFFNKKWSPKFRDVTRGATSATTVAPKCSDTLTLGCRKREGTQGGRGRMNLALPLLFAPSFLDILRNAQNLKKIYHLRFEVTQYCQIIG